MRLTPLAQRTHATLPSSTFCMARRQPLLTSLPRAACVIAARRCSRRRAEALAAAGAQARAAGRVERSAGRAATAGPRWARARGQVRGRPSPWARQRLCKCPGRTPGSPPEVGRAPGRVGTAMPEGPGCGAASGRAVISDLPGKPRQQGAPRAAGSGDRSLTAATRSGTERHALHGVPGVLWRPLPSLQREPVEPAALLLVLQTGNAS